MGKYKDCGVIYERPVVFDGSKGRFGGFSNMAGGYPLRVNGLVFGSSEALYQSCRYPARVEWQKEIAEQASPMIAKQKARKREWVGNQRLDWEGVREEVMAWVLRVKLAQHPVRMGAMLRESGSRLIVEKSRKDCFWGAVLGEDGILSGKNRLGFLLCALRGAGRGPVEPPPVPGFLVNGEPVGVIEDCPIWKIAKVSE